MLNAVIFIGAFLTVTLLIRVMILKDNRNMDNKNVRKVG